MHYMNADISYIIECDRCDETYEKQESRPRINENLVGPIETSEAMDDFLDDRQEEGWEIVDFFDTDGEDENLCPSCVVEAQGEKL